MTINSIEDLKKEADEFEGTQTAFNHYLINLLRKKEMPADVFVEYLEITQMDICECLEEALA